MICANCGTLEAVYRSYCQQCFYWINRLNATVLGGPLPVKVRWPYHPIEKLAYALKTGDYSGANFEGTQRHKIPLDIELDHTVRYEGPPLENIKGSDYCVYFVQERSTGLVKIGRTQDLAFRMTFFPHAKYTLLGAMGNVNFLQEPYLHRRFAEEHHHAEWFEPSSRLLRYIRRYAKVLLTSAIPSPLAESACPSG